MRKVAKPWVVMPLVAVLALGGWCLVQPDDGDDAAAARRPSSSWPPRPGRWTRPCRPTARSRPPDRRPELHVVGHRHRRQREGRRTVNAGPGARDDRLGRAAGGGHRRRGLGRRRRGQALRRRGRGRLRRPARGRPVERHLGPGPARRRPRGARRRPARRHVRRHRRLGELTVGEQLERRHRRTERPASERVGQPSSTSRRAATATGPTRSDASSDASTSDRRSRSSARELHRRRSASTPPTSPTSRSARRRPSRCRPRASPSAARWRRLRWRRRGSFTGGPSTAARTRAVRQRRRERRTTHAGARDRRRRGHAATGTVTAVGRSPTPAPAWPVPRHRRVHRHDRPSTPAPRRPSDHLRPGRRRVQVPALAVTTTTGSTVTVRTQRHERRARSPPASPSGGMVQITSGLKAGEQVVIDAGPSHGNGNGRGRAGTAAPAPAGTGPAMT